MSLTRNTARFDLFRRCYLCFIVLYTVVREVLPLNFLIRSPAVSAAVFAAGFALILWDLLGNADALYDRKADLLLAFTGFVCVSAAANFRYALADNLKAVGTLILFYFLFFSASVEKTREERERDLTAVLRTLDIAWSAFVLVSVVMYFFSIEYVVVKLTGSACAQGFNTQWMRLWGVFQDPNFAGFVCGVSMLSSLWFLAAHKAPALRVLNVLNLLIQFTYIVLGGSRSGLLGLAAGVVLWIVYTVASAGKKKGKKRAATAAAAALCCLGFAALLFGGMRAIQYGLPQLKAAVIPETASTGPVGKAYEALYNGSGLEILYSGYTGEGDAQDIVLDGEAPLDADAPLMRTDLGKSDISNGRFLRWSDTLRVFRHRWLFGTSPRGIVPIAKELEPDTIVAVRGTLSHNGYLDILAFTGVAGAPWMYAFLLLAAAALLKKFFRFEGDAAFAMSAAGTGLLSLSGLFLSELFFVITAGASLFWLLLGYSVHTEPAEKHSLLRRPVRTLTQKFRKQK